MFFQLQYVIYKVLENQHFLYYFATSNKIFSDCKSHYCAPVANIRNRCLHY